MAASLELEARLDNLLATAQAETADIDLFAPIQEKEECPLCLLPLPLEDSDNMFYECCGKRICSGCIHKHFMTLIKEGKERSRDMKCPFCRQSHLSGPQRIKALKKLMKNNEPQAFVAMSDKYKEGKDVLQSDTKSLDMLIRAAELGYSLAYRRIDFIIY